MIKKAPRPQQLHHPKKMGVRKCNVAQWAVRHAEWIRNFSVKSDADMSGVGTKITPHEAHTGDKAPSNVIGFLERVLVRSKINDDKQPMFLAGGALGHKDADIITVVEDGSVRYNGSWRYSPQGRSVASGHELQNALGKMKSQKTKVQGCLACEHGVCEQHTHKYSTYRVAQHDHISSRVHAWLKTQNYTSLCSQNIVIHMSRLIPFRT